LKGLSFDSFSLGGDSGVTAKVHIVWGHSVQGLVVRSPQQNSDARWNHLLRSLLHNATSTQRLDHNLASKSEHMFQLLRNSVLSSSWGWPLPPHPNQHAPNPRIRICDRRSSFSNHCADLDSRARWISWIQIWKWPWITQDTALY